MTFEHTLQGIAIIVAVFCVAGALFAWSLAKAAAKLQEFDADEPPYHCYSCGVQRSAYFRAVLCKDCPSRAR